MLGANTSFKKDSNKIEDNEDLQNAFKLNLTFDEKLEILDNVKSKLNCGRWVPEITKQIKLYMYPLINNGKL